MNLPKLKSISRTRNTIKAFGGYNHTVDCGENEFYEVENLSSKKYPAISPRTKRFKQQTFSNCGGLFVKNGLIYIENSELYYNGQKIATVSSGEKKFCGMGSKVLIWPDKLMFDTEMLSISPLDARWESVSNITLSPSLEDGSEIAVKTSGENEPENPENGDYWLDTSVTATLRVYSSAQETWSAVPTTFIKISSSGIGAHFKKFDTIHASGFDKEVLAKAGEHLNSSLILWDVGEDFVVVTGLLSGVIIQNSSNGTVVLERKIPDLDFIVQSDNRVWGCSNADHAIYSCKLGDATNWFSYMGTAGDSYAVSIGSDGDFTGAAVVLGYVLFFKENLVHKLYGTKPSNYQVTTIACHGVKKGSEKSLAMVHDTLFYLSPAGVVAYDGGIPVYIGQNLGDEQLYAGVGGVKGDSYYLSCDGANSEKYLFVYDTKYRQWQCEDAINVCDFVTVSEGLCMLLKNGELWVSKTSKDVLIDGEEESSVEWSCVSGDLGLYTQDYKYVSKIELRLSAEVGAQIKVEALYDAKTEWDVLAKTTITNQQMIVLPIIPRRYAQMKLRISGKGDVTIYSITKLLEQGSEMTWQI